MMTKFFVHIYMCGGITAEDKEDAKEKALDSRAILNLLELGQYTITIEEFEDGE